MALHAHASEQMELAFPAVSFREDSDSLLIESLEQEYRDMMVEGETDDLMVSLQSAKEWLTEQPGRVAGLFNYLRSLTVDNTRESD